MTMNEFAITFDIDWAPDFAIEALARTLVERRVKATWFVTHMSPAIESLRDVPELFELGIHPNFLPGSTHGKTPTEILANLQAMVPEATCVRTHSLVQSGPLLQMMIESSLKTDVSLFVPGMAGIQPFEFRLKGKSLLRVPYFWSDDYEMEQIIPCWDLNAVLKVQGLKVMNFHPINTYLNMTNPQAYDNLKQFISDLSQLPASVGESFMEEGEGPRAMFDRVVNYVAATGKSLCVRDVYTIKGGGKCVDESAE